LPRSKTDVEAPAEKKEAVVKEEKKKEQKSESKPQEKAKEEVMAKESYAKNVPSPAADKDDEGVWN
jgi:hypothetical protein